MMRGKKKMGLVTSSAMFLSLHLSFLSHSFSLSLPIWTTSNGVLLLLLMISPTREVKEEDEEEEEDDDIQGQYGVLENYRAMAEEKGVRLSMD
jgi:hypothetical protein